MKNSLASIAEELKRLESYQKEINQTHACLFNLIIYSKDPKRTSYLREAIVDIVDKFPCRIIFIEVSDGNKDDLRASVNQVTSGEGDSIIVCDQINIDASVEQLPKVPFAVIPNLVPDLPIYLIWGQDPTVTDPLLTALQKYASRLVVDSETAENLQDFSKKMVQMMEKSQYEILDSQWAILGAWRDILFQIFDTKEKIEHLRYASHIQISYNNLINKFIQHPHLNALFLQGWMAAQLGWKYESTLENEIIYSIENQKVHIHLVPIEAHDRPSGRVISFESSTNEGYSYLISPIADPTKVIVHIFSKELCEMPFFLTLKDMSKGSTFMREIFYRRCGSHYAKMLKVISKIPFGKESR